MYTPTPTLILYPVLQNQRREKMGGEIYNFIVVWLTIWASLYYIHTMAKFIPKGLTRFLGILPITCLFLFLPLKLTSMHLCGLTSFFIAWLANSKLLVFAFGKGPLSSDPPLPLSHFIPMACLPIKIVPNPVKDRKVSVNGKAQEPQLSKKGKKWPVHYAVKIVLFGLLLKVYDYTGNLHPKLLMALYCLHVYFSLEISLAAVGSLARALVGVELEPQFDEPYLCTSLQDFWGKRWNLMVTNILHPTVYIPVRSISRQLIPGQWSSLPAVFVTFLVSGLMHELIFYYMGRLKPTGEVTIFFAIHGVCLGIEIIVKKAVNGKIQLPSFVSGPMALGFVFATAFWLFFPPYLRFQPQVWSCKETVAFIEFVLHGRLVSPSNVSCPYL